MADQQGNKADYLKGYTTDVGEIYKRITAKANRWNKFVHYEPGFIQRDIRKLVEQGYAYSDKQLAFIADAVESENSLKRKHPYKQERERVRHLVGQLTALYGDKAELDAQGDAISAPKALTQDEKDAVVASYTKALKGHYKTYGNIEKLKPDEKALERFAQFFASEEALNLAPKKRLEKYNEILSGKAIEKSSQTETEVAAKVEAADKTAAAIKIVKKDGAQVVGLQNIMDAVRGYIKDPVNLGGVHKKDQAEFIRSAGFDIGFLTTDFKKALHAVDVSKVTMSAAALKSFQEVYSGHRIGKQKTESTDLDLIAKVRIEAKLMQSLQFPGKTQEQIEAIQEEYYASRTKKLLKDKNVSGKFSEPIILEMFRTSGKLAQDEIESLEPVTIESKKSPATQKEDSKKENKENKDDKDKEVVGVKQLAVVIVEDVFMGHGRLQ